jgi:hypothetical protein
MAYTTIDKGSSYFNTVLYTGTSSAQSITGVGFKPDWVWIKDRTSANHHRLLDIIRGATKELYSSSDDAETTQVQSLTTFNSDGFSIGTLAQINTNTNNYVSWNWLASNTTVSNTSGSITSTVSVNTTAGFSIVSYTGTGVNATVGHGLGIAPSFYIVKRRNDTGFNWFCFHSSLGATKFMVLDFTVAVQNGTQWNNTAPTSSVFSVGTPHNSVNSSGGTHIAYCFAEIKGYSKAFSYTGNGSTNGPFVYTGFRPAFVLTKASSATGNWKISWNSFSNGNDYNLAPNLSDSQTSSNQIDLLSNGFKCRATDTDRNASGTTYIGFAIAENPFVSSTGLPVTAR